MMKRMLPILAALFLLGNTWPAPGPGLAPSGGGGGGSVALDAIATHVAVSDTTASITDFTVGGSGTCLLATISTHCGGANPDPSFTGTWNTSESMTCVNTVSSAPGKTSAICHLTSPTTGNHTLTVTVSCTADIYLGAISFTGTSTSACVNAADNVTNTSSDTITVTSDANGATVAVITQDAGAPTIEGTPTPTGTIFTDGSLNPGGGASYTLGGTSNAHTFAEATDSVWNGVGVHVVAP